MTTLLHELRAVLRSLKEEEKKICEKIFRHHRGIAHQIGFTFFINKIKFSAMDPITLTAPSGTPISGFGKPLDSGGNVLPDSAFLTGSVKITVVAGPSGNPPGFTVANTIDEEDFAVTELVPGAASDGQINIDAQDVNGKQLPTASGILVFTAVSVVTPPPPAVAVGIQFAFNPLPAAAAAAGATS